MAFQGFPAAAFEFYEGLEADNTKVFWQANRATFETCVKAPMEALCAELADDEPTDASFHLFRPYNDMRFAKDRPPYKTAPGRVPRDRRRGRPVRPPRRGRDAGRRRLLLDGQGPAGPLPRRPSTPTHTGTEVAEIVAGLAAAGYSIGAMDELKSAPRGYPKDHPRIELLRRKGLMASRSWPPARWMRTAEAAAEVREALAGTAPLCAWLDAHVGPSTLPPDDAWGR